jgi:hypothetical protein
MISGGRHQIGMVAAIRLELVAAIIGIRTWIAKLDFSDADSSELFSAYVDGDQQ